MKSILNSEYFKREGIYPGKCANKVIRSHTCGLASEKTADLAFDRITSSSPNIGWVYGEVAFHHETPTLLLGRDGECTFSFLHTQLE